MDNIPYVKTGESEIDFLIVEELFSSKDFQKWFLEKLNIKSNFKFIRAWKSFIGRYSECDVVVEFIINNKKIIILIEDKIYSSEQPNQAERYHKTGKDLIKNEKVDNYITCLISPKIYFKEDAPMNLYDHKISYEELLEWFKLQKTSKRIEFKKMVILNGINRARAGYQRITDENTTKFYTFYEEIVRKNYPELEYKKPKEVASGNTWIRFTPKLLPSKVTIIHKGNQGCVDLQILDIDIVSFSNKFKDKLKNNMSIHKTGKSVSIRIMVSSIPCPNEIEDPRKYESDIMYSLDSAFILMKWYLDNVK